MQYLVRLLFAIILCSKVYRVKAQKWITGHPCDRPCNEDEPRMECFYSMEATFSRTWVPGACGNCPNTPADCYLPGCYVGDGIVRPLFVTNDMFPGPEIRVCENDIVTVNVTNLLLSGESLTIHWHGIHHYETPFMDGTQMISQCDILFGTTFQYKFVAFPTGTKFWHAHSALLRDQGLAGAFLIRDKFRASGPKYVSFDNDRNRLAVVQDWTPNLSPPYFVRGTGPTIASVVVNGRQGLFGTSPPSYFVYRPYGQKPYLRIISNGFLFCPISLQVEGHRMTVVKGDGFAFKPVTVDKLYIFAAERFDVFLEPLDPRRVVGEGAIAGSTLVYRMTWVGDGDCRNTTFSYVGNATSYLIYTRNDNITVQEAVGAMRTKQMADLAAGAGLTYDRSDAPPAPGELVFNPAHKPDFNTNPAYVRLTDLRALPFNFERPIANPRFRFNLFTDSFVGNRLPNINNISFMHPSYPLLTQYNQIPKNEFCTLESRPECSTTECHCLNLYPIRLNNVVEIIIVDEGHNGRADVHAFHLHGHAFAVLAQQKLGATTTIAEVKQLDQNRAIKRNFNSPIYKDTVAVPEGGFAILRFYADNPGFWLFHCHLGFHLMGGMTIVFKIGELDQFVPAPLGFPRCGSWSADNVNL